MSMININEQIVDRAMGEYVARADVLNAFTLFTPITPVTFGSIVVVPYITGSAKEFSRTDGYSRLGSQSGGVGANGVAITLNNHYHSSVVVNDPQWNVVGEDYAVTAVANARDQVLKTMASQSLALFNIATFATSTAYSASVTPPLGWNNPAAVGDAVIKTIDFPSQKYVLAGSNLLTAMNAPYVSGSTVVTTTTKQLISEYPDFTVIPTSQTFQAGVKGAIVGEGAICVVTGLRTPPAGQTTTKYLPMVIRPGLVLAYREFYDNNAGEMVSVVEGTWGSKAVNTSGGIFIP